MKGYINKIIKSLIVVATLIVATMAMVIPAFAHVGVDPSTASQGGFQVVTFKVPNEDAVASTNKVEIQIPTETPIGYVSVQPKPGWTYSVETTKLEKPIELFGSEVSEVVSKVTFEGGAIKPNEFDEFKISMGPLPEQDTIAFKALQTYDNGEIVRWVDETVEGEEEPEHPAPVMTLTKAAAGEDEHGATTATSESKTEESSTKEESKTLQYVGVGLGGVALLIALAALLKKK
jgi:uncharacterized protein YcnI